MLTTMIALAAAGAASQAPAPSAPPADLAGWVNQVERQIEANLRRPTNGDSGMATVTFRRGVDGRPVDIEVMSSSSFVSRAAVRTIKAAGTLPPMPAPMASNQRVRFNFLVGSPGYEADFERARVRMLAEANRRNTQVAAQLASRTQVAALDRP